MAIILSTEPRMALWMITGLFLSSPSWLQRHRKRGRRKEQRSSGGIKRAVAGVEDPLLPEFIQAVLQLLKRKGKQTVSASFLEQWLSGRQELAAEPEPVQRGRVMFRQSTNQMFILNPTKTFPVSMAGSPRNFSGLVERLSLKVKPNTSYTARRKSRQPLISSSIWRS
ncbi:hypothetical protein EYF80_023223 [Liparis tanakae]|uniref:Uncharacterized protein n=1 Tax=Liparis tanakae TaxID=230148 RepID=A0A4Z2HLC1_9TELE|nr:hypothetical protein EYF80_023223 [Liparis tanakae]